MSSVINALSLGTMRENRIAQIQALRNALAAKRNQMLAQKQLSIQKRNARNKPVKHQPKIEEHKKEEPQQVVEEHASVHIEEPQQVVEEHVQVHIEEPQEVVEEHAPVHIEEPQQVVEEHVQVHIEEPQEVVEEHAPVHIEEPKTDLAPIAVEEVHDVILIPSRHRIQIQLVVDEKPTQPPSALGKVQPEKSTKNKKQIKGKVKQNGKIH